jgi:hypothetical protein
MAILAGIAMTAVGLALLNKVLKGSIWPAKGPHGSKAQIIEIDEFEVLDENQTQSSQGYKVNINDGNN